MSLGVLEHFLINKKGERLVQETLKLLLIHRRKWVSILSATLITSYVQSNLN